MQKRIEELQDSRFFNRTTIVLVGARCGQRHLRCERAQVVEDPVGCGTTLALVEAGVDDVVNLRAAASRAGPHGAAHCLVECGAP